MYRAEISVTVFKIVGIWPPKSFQGHFSIYHVFSCFVACLTFVFTISIALNLFHMNDDIEKFSESFFYVLGLSNACVKMMIIFHKQCKIAKITDMLLSNQFAPRDSDEYYIQSKFDKIGRTETTIFISIIFVAAILRIILSLGSKAILPFNAWIPYNLENRLFFWLTFMLQSLGTMIAGQATAAGDSFAIVMMLQLCSQIEILMHRIKQFPVIQKTDLPNNSKIEQIFLANWIQHHNSLYQFRNNLNEVFSLIFFFQLFGTTLEVCTSTYLLTTFSVTSIKFWSMIVSLSCVMFPVCIYCWHGHMVIEKSKQIGSAAFDADWISLSKESRTSLIHIIRRSNAPINLTAGPVFPLTIDTFNSILRLSYSIYNLLKRPSSEITI